MLSLLVIVFAFNGLQCIPCDIVRQVLQRPDKSGFRLTMKYIEKTRHYYLWDKSGKEWEMTLKMDSQSIPLVFVTDIADQSTDYNQTAINRFSLYCRKCPDVSVNCDFFGWNVTQQNIVCTCTNGITEIAKLFRDFSQVSDTMF